MSLISLVSPVFNEDAHIVEYVRRCTNILSRLARDYEIILVNDGSTDNTGRILGELQANDSKLKVLNLDVNRGQHAATVIGLKEAVGKYVFLMDSDLQVKPEDMEKLLKVCEERSDVDVVSGCRSKRSSSLTRSAGSMIVSKIISWMTGTKLRDPGSAYMLMRRGVVDRICQHDIQAQNLQILIGKMGFNTAETQIEYEASGRRKSNYTLRDLFELLILTILNFTTGKTSMMFLFISGFVLAAIGFISTLTIIVYGMISQIPLRTNYLLLFMFLLLAGIQFIFLGIIAYKLERVNRNIVFRREMDNTGAIISKPNAL